MTEPSPDDRTEMHYTTLSREEIETDRTLAVTIQTRDQLKAVMAQLDYCVTTLQTEIEAGRRRRGVQ